MEIKSLHWLGTEVLEFVNQQFEIASLHENHSVSSDISNPGWRDLFGVRHLLGFPRSPPSHENKFTKN